MTPFSVPNGPLCTGVALVRLRYVQLVRVSTRHEVDFTCSQSTDGNTVVTSNEHVAYGAFQLSAIVLGRKPRRGAIQKQAVTSKTSVKARSHAHGRSARQSTRSLAG